MAIIQNFESTTGLSIKRAYHKIIKVQVDYINNNAIFWVAVYVSKEDREAGRTPIYIKKVNIYSVNDMLGLRKRLYDYLKTTTNYTESMDI